MFEFEKPNIEINEISEDNRFGRFVVEPLERGYGTTLGNSLRRIMLSSLPGAAVSSVKIKGVLHEFSSIPGVKEDVPEIIMNIKSLAIKNNSSSAETKQAYIEFSGKGVVTAGDIKADSDIEILNPELVIATLSDDSSKLDMELTITNGRGYVGADKADKEGKAIDEIAVDAIYTPVERVNLKVENTRVGQITDYDKLTLDVFTNGTLTPDESVSLAAKVLCEHLNLFVDLSENAKTAEVMVEKEDNEKEKVLIEVKRANSSYLKKGYENQLTKYMYASNCKNAFYLIACFTDSEYNTAYKFIRENVYTDEIQMYINIAVLDLRKRKVPSKF